MHKSEHVHIHTKAFLRGLRTVMALHPHIAPPLQATTSKACGGFWAQGFLAPWPRPISADGLHHPVGTWIHINLLRRPNKNVSRNLNLKYKKGETGGRQKDGLVVKQKPQ